MSRLGELLRNGWQGVRTQAGLVLAGLAIFLLAFLLGLHLFFPTAVVQQWLSGEIAVRTPLSLQLTTMSLRPLFTLTGQDVVATYDNRPVVIGELRLRPLWASLITGDPGVSLDAALLQGRLDAELRRGGNFTLHAAGVRLTDFPVHLQTRTLLSGTIVKGDLQGSFPARKGTETRFALEVDNSVLTALGQPVPLGRILLAASGQGSSLRITTLSANGGDLVIAGTGTMLLGASAAASRINLDLTLRPAPSAPPNLAALLDLAGQRQSDNSYRVKLSGPLNQMTVEQTMPPQVQPHLQQSQADEDE